VSCSAYLEHCWNGNKKRVDFRQVHALIMASCQLPVPLYTYDIF
jgi:hypothetical protein